MRVQKVKLREQGVTREPGTVKRRGSSCRGRRMSAHLALSGLVDMQGDPWTDWR